MKIVRFASRFIGTGLGAPDIAGAVDKVDRARRLIPGQTTARKITLSEKLRGLLMEHNLSPRQRQMLEEIG